MRVGFANIPRYTKHHCSLHFRLKFMVKDRRFHTGCAVGYIHGTGSHVSLVSKGYCISNWRQPPFLILIPLHLNRQITVSSHFTHRNGEEPQEHDFLNLKTRGWNEVPSFHPQTCILHVLFAHVFFAHDDDDDDDDGDDHDDDDDDDDDDYDDDEHEDEHKDEHADEHFPPRNNIQVKQ